MADELEIEADVVLPLVLLITRSSASVSVPLPRLMRLSAPEAELTIVANPVPPPSWLNVIGFESVNDQVALREAPTERVPTVTPPTTS